jgi:NEDD8-activating enzyme E1 regulatory subunit
MSTTTDLFMQLQEVFAAKAKQDRSDLAELIESLRQSTTSVGMPFPHIDSDLIDRFCKNVYNLRSLSTTTLADERTELPVQAINDAVADAFEQDKKQTPILWYLSLLAADRFFSSSGRYPGTGQTHVDIERDSEAVWLFLQDIRDQLSPVSVNSSENMDEEYTPDTARGLLTKEHALEIVRVGACELHNIAALVGGIAAQEIVKLITRQYIPMNNSYVFNGITGVGATYEL